MSDVSKLEQLRGEVFAGTLNRRDVLRRGLALGLSAPVIASLLAACGGDDGGDDTGDEDTGGEATPTEAERSAPGANAGATQTAEAGGGEATEAPTEADTGGATEAATEAATEEGGATEAATEGATESAGGGGGGRGEGGGVRLMYWQAPTILNAHFSQGTKDFHASQVCLEPLFNWDENTEPILYLAAEWPTVENGLLAEDGTSVTWKLKEGVKWHDGEDFTAEDVKFTYDFVSKEEMGATTIGSYTSVESVEVVDDYTIQVNFSASNPAWFNPFSGGEGLIIPQHLLGDLLDSPQAAREADYNLKPIGTGPWMVREFRPGDIALYDVFEDYWEEGKPFFSEVEIKGGGDAASAARAVLVTGEADWAWNLQVEPQVLNQMVEEGGGQGELLAIPGTGTERLMMNFADPNTEVEGERAHVSTDHPIWQHKEARQAMNLLVQRDVVANELYGEAGVATPHAMNVPEKFEPEHSWEFSIEKAQEQLSSINFPDDFESTRILYQTSVNSVRQKNQEIVKAAMEQVGFTVELKAIESSVYFSGDPGNPDTTGHFYADLEMYTNGPGSPYPLSWAERYRSDEVAQEANGWSLNNYYRYQNPEYDKLHDQLKTEMNEDRQVELWQQMLAMVYEDIVDVPTVWRGGAAAKANRIKNAPVSPWSATPMFGMKEWTL